MTRRRPSPLLAWSFQFDYLLFLFVLATTILGLIVLRGGTLDVAGRGQFFEQQMDWLKVALAVFLIAVVFPYRWLKVLGWPMYFFGILLLLILYLSSRGKMGFLTMVHAGGASSWIRLSLGAQSIQFQPSEFAKIATVFVLSAYLAWRREHLGKLRESFAPLVLAAVPTAFIFMQPDFGTASVFLPLPFILLFVAGLPWRIVLTSICIGGVLLCAGLVYLLNAESVPGLRQYQLKRIHVFLEPITQPFMKPGIEEILYGASNKEPTSQELDGTGEKKRLTSDDDWNIRQAEMALGSGGAFGKGWGKGTQSRFRFLPEPHTDFIFSSLGEQFGLAGCLTLLILYVLICWRSLRIAVLCADPFGKYMTVGLLSIFIIHVFLNVGMSVRFLPVTGLPLPLVSYGGSFLATNYLIFGFICNVGMRREMPEASGFSD